MTIPVILDTDIATDVDDCLALALILASPELDLLGVTCAYGDVDLRARFAAKLLGLAGRADVPVTAGARLPLLNKRTIYWGGHEGRGLLHDTPEDATIRYSGEHAVDFIVRMAGERPGEIHLLAIAPLTNVALALMRAPDLPLKHITLMGGVVRAPGRLDLPIAEHNIVCDPEAAHVVFSSGIPTTIVPLDLTTTVRLHIDGAARIRAAATPFQQAVAGQVEAYPFFAANGYTFLHDPLAAATLADPTLVQTTRVRAQVELAGEYTAGATLFRADASGSIDLAVAVDAPRFEAFLVERLANREFYE
jgi:purine nucleosidase